MPDLTDTIEEVAAGPAAASNDNGSVSEHRLSELIDADKYLKANEAAANNTNRGIRFSKLCPPSALG